MIFFRTRRWIQFTVFGGEWHSPLSLLLLCLTFLVPSDLVFVDCICLRTHSFLRWSIVVHSDLLQLLIFLTFTAMSPLPGITWKIVFPSLFMIFFGVGGGFLLYQLGWLQTHNPPVPVSGMLGLQTCAITSGLRHFQILFFSFLLSWLVV